MRRLDVGGDPPPFVLSVACQDAVEVRKHGGLPLYRCVGVFSDPSMKAESDRTISLVGPTLFRRVHGASHVRPQAGS